MPPDISVCQHYWPLSAYHRSYIKINICSQIKLFCEAENNAWTSDLKWCNYVVCPAEGDLLFKN